MKKFALLVSMVAVVASIGVGVASANEQRVVAEERGFTCGIFNADGSIAITTESRATLLYNGKEILHCQGQATGNGSIVTFEGFLCGMVFTGLSEDPNNNAKVAKSGWSQLWCYNRAAPAAAPTGGPAGAIG